MGARDDRRLRSRCSSGVRRRWRCCAELLAALDGQRRPRARRRRARRRQDDARAAAHPGGGAAGRARRVRAVLRVGGHRPVLAVRRDARSRRWRSCRRTSSARTSATTRPRSRAWCRSCGAASPTSASRSTCRRSSSAATSSTPSASFIARGSTRFPLLLVMDDVHWADEPTLLLIEHMAAADAATCACSASARTATSSSTSSRPLAATLERLRARPRTVERHRREAVRPRRRRADARGARRQAGAGRSSSTPIFERDRGQPVLRRGGLPPPRRGGQGLRRGRRVPHRHRGRRARRARERAARRRPAARAARRRRAEGARGRRGGRAAASRSRCSRRSPTSTRTRCSTSSSEAEAARVIVPEERGRRGATTRSRHELIRQTLLSGLSLLRRQRLHLAVADAIERTDPARARDRPSEIADHLLQAGAAADASARSGTSS